MKKQWRCFHCDELFKSEACARKHFGATETSTPACQLKSGADGDLLKVIRQLEEEIEDIRWSLHNDNTEAAKAYMRQQSRHSETLKVVEQRGYDKGLAGSRHWLKELRTVSEALQKLDTLYREEYDSAERPAWLQDALHLAAEQEKNILEDIVKHTPRRRMEDETEILQRLATGDTIVFSSDGDEAWLTCDDQAFVGYSAITGLRQKGYLLRKRYLEEDDDSRGMADYDTISDAGLAFLSKD